MLGSSGLGPLRPVHADRQFRIRPTPEGHRRQPVLPLLLELAPQMNEKLEQERRGRPTLRLARESLNRKPAPRPDPRPLLRLTRRILFRQTSLMSTTDPTIRPRASIFTRHYASGSGGRNSCYPQELPGLTPTQRGKAKWETIQVKATPEVAKAIQVRAVSRARAGRAAGQTMLRVRAARAPLVRETRAKEPLAKGILAKAIPETLVSASQAKATREAAARDRTREDLGTDRRRDC